MASTLAPTSHRPRNSALTFASFTNTCNATSDAACFGELIHPSAPPLLERASNSLKNATKDEKVKWSLTNETNRYNTDDAKPTWDDDDDDDDGAERKIRKRRKKKIKKKTTTTNRKQWMMATEKKSQRVRPRKSDALHRLEMMKKRKMKKKKKKEQRLHRMPNLKGTNVVKTRVLAWFGVPVNSEKLSNFGGRVGPFKSVQERRGRTTEEEKVWQVLRKQAVEKIRFEGALPDIVFGGRARKKKTLCRQENEKIKALSVKSL